MKLKVFFLILAVLAVLVIAFSLPLIVNFGKTGKNTAVLNKDYSLLSKKQIISRLDTDFPLPPAITLQSTDQKFSFDLSSISARLDTDTLLVFFFLYILSLF